MRSHTWARTRITAKMLFFLHYCLAFKQNYRGGKESMEISACPFFTHAACAHKKKVSTLFKIQWFFSRMRSTVPKPLLVTWSFGWICFFGGGGLKYTGCLTSRCQIFLHDKRCPATHGKGIRTLFICINFAWWNNCGVRGVSETRCVLFLQGFKGVRNHTGGEKKTTYIGIKDFDCSIAA